MSVGFWFSLGHSSIVFGLALLISLGVRALDGPVRHSGRACIEATGWLGYDCLGRVFVCDRGAEIVILVGILKVFREMKTGRYDEGELEGSSLVVG